MPGLIASIEYTKHADALRREDDAFDDVIDAAEWDLTRAVEFSRYPAFARTSKGPVHYLVIPATAVRPGLVVLFTFEHNGGEDKVLLIDLRRHVPDEAEGDGDDE